MTIFGLDRDTWDSLDQWFLNFFAPWTPNSPKNFHGPLKLSKNFWWTPVTFKKEV